jgi:hypothetical protein
VRGGTRSGDTMGCDTGTTGARDFNLPFIETCELVFSILIPLAASFEIVLVM